MIVVLCFLLYCNIYVASTVVVDLDVATYVVKLYVASIVFVKLDVAITVVVCSMLVLVFLLN